MSKKSQRSSNTPSTNKSESEDQDQRFPKSGPFSADGLKESLFRRYGPEEGAKILRYSLAQRDMLM